MSKNRLRIALAGMAATLALAVSACAGAGGGGDSGDGKTVTIATVANPQMQDIEKLSREYEKDLAREDTDRVLLGFRPESVEPVGPSDGFPVTVRLVEELGADAYLYGSIAGAEHSDTPDIITRINPSNPPRVGDTVHLKVRTGQEHAFSTTTGQRLGNQAA